MLHSFSGDELFTALLAEQRVRWVNPRCSHAFTIMKTDDSLWERTAVKNCFAIGHRERTSDGSGPAAK